jgi:hypothetical protein
MEYQSNISHNSNAPVFTTDNGATNGIASNTASGSENRKPTAAQQLVRENVQYLIEQLETGHSEALTAYLNAMVHFHRYSFLCSAPHRNDYVQSRTMLSAGGKLGRALFFARPAVNIVRVIGWPGIRAVYRRL